MLANKSMNTWMQKTTINLWQRNTVEDQIMFLDSGNKHLDKLKIWKQVNTKVFPSRTCSTIACMGLPLFEARSPIASKLLESPTAEGGKFLMAASEAPGACKAVKKENELASFS